MSQQRPEVLFLQLCYLLAQQTGYQMTPEYLEYYRVALQPLGFEKVNRALKELLETARRFPTVGEVKDLCGQGDTHVYGDPAEIAEKIVGAMRMYGSWSHNIEKVCDHIGPVGQAVVNIQGGWKELCASVDDNDQLSALKAQWRQSAAAVIARWKAESYVPPEFVALDGPEKEPPLELPGELGKVVAEFITADQREALRDKFKRMRRDMKRDAR